MAYYETVDTEIILMHKCLDRLEKDIGRYLEQGANHSATTTAGGGGSIHRRPKSAAPAQYVGPSDGFYNVAHRRSMGRFVAGPHHRPIEPQLTYEDCDIAILRASTRRLVILMKEEMARYREEVEAKTLLEGRERIQQLETAVEEATAKLEQSQQELKEALEPENARKRWQEFVQQQRKNELLLAQMTTQDSLDSTYAKAFRRKMFNELGMKGKWTRFENMAKELQTDFGTGVDELVEEYAGEILHMNRMVAQRNAVLTPMSTKKKVKTFEEISMMSSSMAASMSMRGGRASIIVSPTKIRRPPTEMEKALKQEMATSLATAESVVVVGDDDDDEPDPIGGVKAHSPRKTIGFAENVVAGSVREITRLKSNLLGQSGVMSHSGIMQLSEDALAMTVGDRSVDQDTMSRSMVDAKEQRLVVMKNLEDGKRKYLSFDVSKSLWSNLLQILTTNNANVEVTIDMETVLGRNMALQSHATQLGIGNLHYHAMAFKLPWIRVKTLLPPAGEGGIVQHLSTSGGRIPFQNVVTSGLVSVYVSSSYQLCSTTAIVSPKDTDYFMTLDHPDEMITIDFGNVLIVPQLYSFTSRHPILAGFFPRFWRVEASLDNQTWYVLRRHVNDVTMHRHNPTGCWEISPSKSLPYFRWFRIVQEGKNCVGSNVLAVSNLEVFGRILTIDEYLPHTAPPPPFAGARPRAWEVPFSLPEQKVESKQKKKK
eukprot:PhF_6_TR1031/c0_g1_i1/m.2095